MNLPPLPLSSPAVPVNPPPARRFPRGPLLGALVALAFLAIAPAAEAADKRVLIISVDGLRPDLALRGDCPILRGLMERGSFTLWAQTTPLGKTLPSHTSMLTGQTVPVHGIRWNSTKVPAGVEYTYAQVPTLFALARQHGYSTAMVAGKRKFGALDQPDTLDHRFVPDELAGDLQVTDEAVRLVRAHAPQVLFVHLPQTDSTGHKQGWGSPEQMRVIAQADQCIGRVLAALEERGMLAPTLVIVTADHGGWRKNHDGSDPRGRTIPWIASGPGVVPGRDLTLVKDLQVRTEDTFATACAFLGIPLPEGCEGVPVAAIFDEGAAVAPAKAAPTSD